MVILTLAEESFPNREDNVTVDFAIALTNDPFAITLTNDPNNPDYIRFHPRKQNPQQSPTQRKVKSVKYLAGQQGHVVEGGILRMECVYAACAVCCYVCRKWCVWCVSCMVRKVRTHGENSATHASVVCTLCPVCPVC